MFDRPGSGENAILVHVTIGQALLDNSRQEFAELATSAGATILDEITATRARPEPRFFVGSGKVEEIAERVRETGAQIVMFDQTLSPSQERNLERMLQCRVLDRTGLILDIFAQRARSFEGKLQVELAQLQHLSTRLVRGWTHLERQKGGIGLRGPGETQLETDRRLLAQRIKQIRRKLDNVRRQRDQGRQSRRKAEVPTISLVGYTNAGKSTLFNRLTQAEVYAADQLFATLDPTLRRWQLGEGQEIVLADTVGFVSRLPHELVDAFHATLQETRDADLLMHVIDASDDHRVQHTLDVEEVLGEIGAEKTPQLRVYNKVDLADLPARVDRDDSGAPVAVWLSAISGAGIELLVEVVRELFRGQRVSGWLPVAVSQGRLRAALYALEAVVEERRQPDGVTLVRIDLDSADWRRLCKRESIDDNALQKTDSALVSRSAAS